MNKWRFHIADKLKGVAIEEHMGNDYGSMVKDA